MKHTKPLAVRVAGRLPDGVVALAVGGAAALLLAATPVAAVAASPPSEPAMSVETVTAWGRQVSLDLGS